MRFACFVHQGAPRVGIVREQSLLPAPAAWGDLTDIVRGGAAALQAAGALLGSARAEAVSLASARLLAPLTRLRRDVLCVGWNYIEHFEEGRGLRNDEDKQRPEHPTFFTKGPDVLIGPNDDIGWDPQLSDRWDYEAELALVIGRDGRGIPRARGYEHVWGYCMANDVSQRDLQRRHGGQWLKGKSIDGSMPLGPWLVTADEVDPANVQVECFVNGERRQSASTAQMAFPIPHLLEELSFGMTLRAGDLFITGTPSGVGFARNPPLWLRAGDEIVTRGSGIGELRNRLVPADLHGYA
ncbi:MAG: fumarylacetoacetate hydrolase family protein [Gammaproteobacteria bacterium]